MKLRIRDSWDYRDPWGCALGPVNAWCALGSGLLKRPPTDLAAEGCRGDTLSRTLCCTTQKAAIAAGRDARVTMLM
jgi:hypothetical protein